MDNAEYREKYGPWTIVIGASVGLGAAIARAMAAKGLNVIVSARCEEKLVKLAQEIEETYKVKAMALPLDILRSDAYEIMEEKTKHLQLNSAVFSAAYCIGGAFLAVTDEQYQRQSDLNMNGAYRFARYFGKRFCLQRKGGLLFLGSLGGYYGLPGMSMYVATKAFEILLGQSLWGEFKLYNVDVTVDLIGSVATQGFYDMFKDVPNAKEERHAEDEDVVAVECVNSLGTGPAAIITQEMRDALDAMRKSMDYVEQIEITSEMNTDNDEFQAQMDQFPDKPTALLRLGQVIGG